MQAFFYVWGENRLLRSSFHASYNLQKHLTITFRFLRRKSKYSL